MNIRILFVKIISSTALAILSISIMYYFIHYQVLSTNLLVDLKANSYRGIMGLVLIIVSLIKIKSTCMNIKAAEIIKFKVTELGKKLSIVVMVLVWMALFNMFIAFFTYTSFSLLLEIIFMLGILFYSSLELFIETWLGENGIIYKGTYYCWEEIKSFSWKNDGNKLVFKFLRKEPLIFSEGTIKLRVKSEDKLAIDNLIKLKLKD